MPYRWSRSHLLTVVGCAGAALVALYLDVLKQKERERRGETKRSASLPRIASRVDTNGGGMEDGFGAEDMNFVTSESSEKELQELRRGVELMAAGIDEEGADVVANVVRVSAEREVLLEVLRKALSIEQFKSIEDRLVDEGLPHVHFYVHDTDGEMEAHSSSSSSALPFSPSSDRLFHDEDSEPHRVSARASSSLLDSHSHSLLCPSSIDRLDHSPLHRPYSEAHLDVLQGALSLGPRCRLPNTALSLARIVVVAHFLAK